MVEANFVDTANSVIERARERSVALLLPVDVVAARGTEGQAATVDADGIPDGWAAFDIGPKTIEQYSSVIAGAKTIFWNGPMGVFEKPAFANGTLAIAKAVAGSDAYSVVGGEIPCPPSSRSGLADRISHISTGGGASLEFIEGRELPGIAALRVAKRMSARTPLIAGNWKMNLEEWAAVELAGLNRRRASRRRRRCRRLARLFPGSCRFRQCWKEVQSRLGPRIAARKPRRATRARFPQQC